MTQPTETDVIPLQLVSCETCDNAFLSSPRRQTCPGCGGAAGLSLVAFEASDNGLRQVDAPPPAQPAAAPADVAAQHAAPPPPAAEAEQPPAPDTPEPLTPAQLFPVAAGSYLDVGFPSPDDLTVILLDMGAEPDVAATTTGRLTAVRDVLQALTTPPAPDIVDNSQEQPTTPLTAATSAPNIAP